ncbi:hypothetical protein CALCODRAFT_11 [Calocera cornea HHB12733]|uniref:Uncharacterized protein n=1 Tax=Calocera cornea HHB12733 TaxID=1353952 RepID=A0A165K6A4_9BASI|nr:hypothetical protein CALCODRAFT_11 [Calocera cornea HHB12733]
MHNHIFRHLLTTTNRPTADPFTRAELLRRRNADFPSACDGTCPRVGPRVRKLYSPDWARRSLSVSSAVGRRQPRQRRRRRSLGAGYYTATTTSSVGHTRHDRRYLTIPLTPPTQTFPRQHRPTPLSSPSTSTPTPNHPSHTPTPIPQHRQTPRS